MQFTKTEQSLYYGFCHAVFGLAGYKLSGGAFNMSFIIGGMVFNRIITSNILAMFIGSLLGCLTARLFYDQFLERKKPVDALAESQRELTDSRASLKKSS